MRLLIMMFLVGAWFWGFCYIFRIFTLTSNNQNKRSFFPLVPSGQELHKQVYLTKADYQEIEDMDAMRRTMKKGKL